MLHMVKREFSVKKFYLNLDNDGSFNKSWILPSWALVLVRLTMAMFCVTIIIISGVQQGSAKWFIYLTYWSYLFLTMSVLGLSILSIIHKVQGTDYHAQKDVENAQSEENDSNLIEKQTWFQEFIWFLWIVSSNAAIIVTLNYWILVFTPPTDFVDIAVHALNTVVMLIELFLGSIPVRLLHIVYVLAFATGYCTFVVVYWAAGGTNGDGDSFIYEVLDFENGNHGIAVGVLLATVFVLCPLAQLILFGLYQLRSCLERKSSTRANVA